MTDKENIICLSVAPFSTRATEFLGDSGRELHRDGVLGQQSAAPVPALARLTLSPKLTFSSPPGPDNCFIAG
jgi:hypothetical protein